MRLHVVLKAASLVLIGLAAAEAAAKEALWAGKTIFMKRKGVSSGFTGKDGQDVLVANLTAVQYRVLKDRDGWLQVSHNGVKGWFDKNEAVVIDEAVEYFTEIIRRNPRDDAAFSRRALVWRVLGNMDNAIRDYSRAIAIDPSDPGWWNNRGNAWHIMGEYQKAISDFNEAIRLGANSALRHANRGNTQRALKKYDLALADYNTALEINPRYAVAFAYRGLTWAKKGQYRNALADINRAFDIDDQNFWVIDAKAWLLATAGDSSIRDGKEAVALAHKACEWSEWRQPSLVSTLAAAHAEAGQFKEAIKSQEKALQDPLYARVHGHEGRERLKAYKAGKPVREPAPAEATVSNPVPLSKSGTPSKGSTPISWVDFQAPDKSFAIRFPGKPKDNKQTLPSAVGRIVMHAWSHESPGLTCVVSYFDLPGDALLTLEAAAKAYTAGRKAKLLNEKDITLGDSSGKEIRVRMLNGTVSLARIFEVGARRFQIIVEGSEAAVDSENARKYFGSFKLVR